MMEVKSDIVLHNGQKRIIKELLTNPVRYNVVNASRQFGKSILGRELVNWFAFNFNQYENQVLKPKNLTARCKIVWTSPTIPQAKKVYKEFEDAWAPILKYRNKTERLLVTKNNTQVRFYGVDKPDNIRGDNANYMICDEYAFYKDDVFNTVLRPMLAVQGKMVFFISTPHGLNDFYELHKKGISPDFQNYKYSQGLYTENPYYNLEEVEDAKQNLPIDIFKQEYLAEFVGGGASVFGNISDLMVVNSWDKPIETMEYYNGNDIAKQKDWTVSTTIDKNHRIVNQVRMRQMDWQEIINGIVSDLENYKSYALMEVNGAGDPVYDLVKRRYQQVYPFLTTNQSKQMLISNLIASCKTKSIKLPTKELCPSLHEQLDMFTFDYSEKTRQITYNAREGYHDDDVISLALANMQFKRFNP
jgi:hypothetical protein